MKRIMLEAFF